MLFVAENINVMSKSLGPAMRNRDAGPIENMAKILAANGADYLDINVGPARKNGAEMVEWMVKTVQGVVDKPLWVDTTNIEAMEAGLKAHNNSWGRPIINSIDATEARMDKMIPMVSQYKTKMVALLYGVDGIPRDENERGLMAADLLMKTMEAGIPPEDIFYDPIVVPVSSQQNQVVACTAFMEMLPEIAPGAGSTCGLSNISNGSPEELRHILNHAYVIMLKHRGMSSAILDGLDKTIMDIAKDRRPDLEEAVTKAESGEWTNATEGLSEDQMNMVKSVKILTNNALYSDSWLEL